MSVTKSEKNKQERRAFPRFKAQCELHYFAKNGGVWNQAILKDYSAGGVCFLGEETLTQDSKISIQITRDAHPAVPPMTASAVVVRCEIDENHRYRIACKLTRVRDEKDQERHYLRR